jgi:AcrR family transcriptional regulator
LNGKETRFAVTYSDGVERLAATVEAAAAKGGDWVERVAAGLGAGLEFLASDRRLSHLLLVEVFAANRPTRLEHERSVQRLAEALRPPAELARGTPISDEILLLRAHGLVSYLSGRVLAGETGRLSEDHEPLLRFLVAQLPSDR